MGKNGFICFTKLQTNPLGKSRQERSASHTQSRPRGCRCTRAVYLLPSSCLLSYRESSWPLPRDRFTHSQSSYKNSYIYSPKTIPDTMPPIQPDKDNYFAKTPFPGLQVMANWHSKGTNTSKNFGGTMVSLGMLFIKTNFQWRFQEQPLCFLRAQTASEKWHTWGWRGGSMAINSHVALPEDPGSVPSTTLVGSQRVTPASGNPMPSFGLHGYSQPCAVDSHRHIHIRNN